MKKTLLALCVVSLAAGSAQAQLFRPTVVEGAVIGALAGAVIGAVLDDRPAPRPVVVSPPPVCVSPPPQVVYVYETPVCPPPPPAPVVVYYSRPVTVYSGYVRPPRPVVYVNPGGPPWSCAPQYGHGHWR